MYGSIFSRPVWVVDLLFLRNILVPLPHGGLNFNRERHCVDHTAKLHEGAITHQLDGATVILPGFRLNELPAKSFERRERAGFVLAHQARIAHDISSKNCSETTFHPILPFTEV